MKNNVLISAFLLFTFTNICSQNLIINSSFEDVISCPPSPAQIQHSVNWYAYRHTPDYFNSCLSDPNGFSVPTNAFGYQLAATGNAYGGFFSYGTNAGDTIYREYIGGQLSTMLNIGQKYFISFKINLTDNREGATNNLGILFSTIPYSYSNPAPIKNFAHVYTTEIVTDTANWTTISGSIIADSAYQYIIIGNFFDNQLTSYIQLDNNTPIHSSYYFVDDICVSTDALTCGITAINENENGEESISVFPNPISGNATIKYTLPQGASKGEIIIYDITGKEVKRIEVTNGNSKIVVDNFSLQAGTYFYQLITSKGAAGTKKMVVVK